MGQIDWQDLDDSLSDSVLKRGVTAGITGPNGTNGFVFGYNSLTSVDVGAHGKYVNLAGFIPTGSGLSSPDGGGSIRGAVRRVASPNNIGMSPFLFFCAQGGPPSVNDDAYMIGLLDEDPYKIVMAKGPISGGLVRGSATILAESSGQYMMGDALWHQLRMDVLVEPNGDVVLKGMESDLAVHSILSPDWQNIPGFNAQYIDDALQIATGSAPLWGGYAGWAFAVNRSLNRRGAFDGIQVYRTI